MRYSNLPMASLLLVAILTNGSPADDFDPAARARAIAPYIDSQAVMIVHADLTRLEPDPLIDRFQKVFGASEIDHLNELKGFRQAVIQSGVKEFYGVVSLADVPTPGPFLIIPHLEGIDVQALTDCFAQQDISGIALHPVDGSLFVGPSQTLERVKSKPADPRTELETAFVAAGDTVSQILVLPPRYAKRVVEEIMPVLPPQLGSGPSSVLTDGLKWAALGADGPPHISLKLVVQSQDAEAAMALSELWQQLGNAFVDQIAHSQDLPDAGQAVELLRPKVEQDQLVLELDEAAGTIQALLTTLTPPVEAARNKARRMQSSNNLKQMAIAMHNFHDTRKSFPAVGNADASGKLLLSWRVHLLPYVDQMELYKQFHLDEPWDSHHNRTLIDKMPAVYECPGLGTGKRRGFPPTEYSPAKEPYSPARTASHSRTSRTARQIPSCWWKSTTITQ